MQALTKQAEDLGLWLVDGGDDLHVARRGA
jgi:hypothetical protein